MKKFIMIFVVAISFGLIFWSCSDDDGGTSPEPENIAPTCNITSPLDSLEFFIGDTITVSVNATDEDGTIVEVRFFLNETGTYWDSSFPFEYNLITSTLADSTYIIKAVAEDDDGENAESEIVFFLNELPNNPPLIDSLILSPSSVEINGTSSITCFASDADGDFLSYTWEKSRGVISGTESAITWTAPNTVGEDTISCIVSDGEFTNTQTAIITVTEPPNNPPQITSLIAEPDSVHIGETSTLTCTATDMDGDVLTYEWSSTGGSISGTDSSATWTATSILGTFTITCVVSDGIEADTSSISIKTIPPVGMIYVEGGTFEMGQPSPGIGGLGATEDEQPVHSVTVSDFYIGRTEITQAELAQYMTIDTYDNGAGDDFPVYYVSWYEAIKYCNLRSIDEGLTPCYTIIGSTNPIDWGSVPTSSNPTWNAASCNWNVNGYRLPSEAEWEYAAKGGINWSDDYMYSGDDSVTEVAWCYFNSGSISHSVATIPSNQLSIYDMSGNVNEWCWDWYGGSSYYSTCNDLGTIIDPYGPTSGFNRVKRGGYWLGSQYNCRVASRDYQSPYSSLYSIGFRIARTQ